MKKRVAFRSFVILLATALLLSSTGAYNILVYANQDSVANSISAIESASDSSADTSAEPNISVQGGDLNLESDSENEPELQDADELQGEGSQTNPYIIETAAQLLAVNTIVNATVTGEFCHVNTDKYFKLANDIDIGVLFAAGAESPFVNAAGNAYLISADYRNAASNMVYINIDGSYTTEDGKEAKHKIYFSDPNAEINLSNHESFAIFGYLGTNSVVSNIIFENINVSVTSLQPKRVSVISYMNEGRIENCEINNCSVSLSSSSTDGASVSQEGYTFYNGIAAAVADNRAAMVNVKVNNFTATLPDAANNDYVGALVGQNRGLVDYCSVSGVSISVSSKNHYIGALAGYNGTDGDIQNSSVDLAGADKITRNIRGGGYVGGLTGLNDGYIYQSTVKGSVNSAHTPSASSYNMMCSPESASENVAYYGGITGVNRGEIVSTTASDIGFYMSSSSYVGYYGGIAARTTGTITGCVASGSFISSSNIDCYAGGIVAIADSNTPDGAITDCYSLVRLTNPSKEYIGAIIGFGGNVNTATGCYWSDAITKCVTAFVFEDTNDASRPYVLETSAGKLVSSNRGVKVNRGGVLNVAASEIVHVFNPISGTTPATVSVANNLSINGSGSNNTVVNKEYLATFSFPEGIGAASMQNLDVAVNMDVFITSANGDPDDLNNPLVINSTASAKFIYLAPYGHYKITTDIVITADLWTKSLFTGTIDGGDNIIATDTAIFDAVIGTRDESPYINKFVSDPEADPADRSGGTVSNLNIEFSDDISESIFGTVYNSTIFKVALTDGDITPDDGYDQKYEGKIAKVQKQYAAPFIDCAIGNSYIYGCSSDVSVEIGNYNYTSAFIGFVYGNVYVDNCSVTSVGVYIADSATDKLSRAAFIGNTKENNGYILNSIVNARIIGKGNCFVFIGEHKGMFNNRYNNLVWSSPDFSTSNTESAVEQEYISKWGGEDTPVKLVSIAGSASYSVAIPQNITLFKDASAADFLVSLVDISADKSETAVTDSVFTLNNVVVKDGALNIDVAASSSAQVGDEVYVKIYHFETGFLSYVKYQVKSSAFVKNEEDGYFHIASAEDLITLSNACKGNDASSYLGEPYKLVNDIDMSEITAVFTPIGTSTMPFTGIFDGNGHTIKYMNLEPESGSAALFGAVSFASNLTIKGESVKSGVYNLTVSDSSFVGVDSAAVIAASVSGSTANIHDITVVDTTVKSSGKNAAAILASATNSNVNIYNITLDNVSVRTKYSSNEPYFMNATAIGGIGGVIGSVVDLVTDSHSVTVQGIEINKLTVAGYNDDDSDSYADVNAGALIGTYHKHFNLVTYSPSTLTVGVAKESEESGYDISVTDSLIMSAGMAGGLIGTTNARTTITNATVRGTTEQGTKVLSTTDYYVGGIAGYVGPYAGSALDGAVDTAVTSIYGTVTDCSVENAVVQTDDPLLKQTATTNKVRNASVGGIVGAINGPATGDTLLDCTVKNSLIVGVVTGGIVGSNINLVVATGNVVHITNCDVFGSTVTTPETCYPLASTATANGNNYFGVGGIMGTSRISNKAYITDLVITYCDVDADTSVTNYIPYNNGTATIRFHAVTGGILGSTTQYANGVQVLLQYNSVSAYLYTRADMNLGTTINASNLQYQNIRVATGGFIGMFNGDSATASAGSAQLFKLSVQDSVFDGSIVSTDCIGGAIGAIINSYGRKSTSDYLPTDLLCNIVISGSLKSTVTANAATKVRGGVLIGNINLYISTTISSTTYLYHLQAKSTDDLTKVFHDIYFSSFDTAIDFDQFPLLGYANANKSVTAATNGYPTYTVARTMLRPCYIDVNLKEDNQTAQLAPAGGAEDYVIPNASQTAPAALRGPENTGFRLDVADKDGNMPHWVGSDPSVATVSDTEYDNLTVSPKTPGNNVYVSIDYIGKVSDSNGWSYEARLPVGFLFSSTATLNLKTETYNGKTYYLITDPIDFRFITGDALSYNYWLANDIVFTEEMFAEGKSYSGGFTPLGTADKPFTGTFGSKANGTGEQYEISGLQLKAAGDTQKVSGLFGYVSGASFSNFRIADVTSSAGSDYAAAVAAVVNGSLTADKVTVENAKISGAKYSAGLFGGLFGDSTNSWSITDSSLIGTAEDGNYSTVIEGSLAAAGIVVHSDENAASLSGVSVDGCEILQDPDGAATDSTTYDNGAAGISVAYSGSIAANGENRNSVSNSHIKGEIAAGAVVRTYTSESGTAFTPSSEVPAEILADSLSISAVDIFATEIEGTHTQAPAGTARYFIASGGILARVDALGVAHSISDCTLDSDTQVKAPYAVGGILGTFESPVNSNAVSREDVYEITIDGCKSEADVIMTVGISISTSDDFSYYTMGAGGVIGYFSNFGVLSGVNIRNCSIGGSVSGVSAVGGLIGAIWTNFTAVSFAKFNSMDSHFAENCVISADLKTADGIDAFSANNSTTGIVVGHVHDVAVNGSSGNFGTNTSFNGLTNQPFFNIYYSGYNYSSGSAYLFGVVSPGSNNSVSMNSIPCYTDYIYEMNYSYTNSNNNHEIDQQTHALRFSDQYRITNTDSLTTTPEENGVWVVDSRAFVNGMTVETSKLTFDVSPQSNDSVRNYIFDSQAGFDGFTLSTVAGAGENAGSTTAVLENVKADNAKITVETSGSGYLVKPVSTLTETLVFNLVFVYSNGLELAVAFRIEVSGNDYYYNEATNTYYVFNASNLYSTIEKANASATIIQCYDIFCAIDADNPLIASANSYAESVTLSQVYGSLLDDIADTKHPNPEYDPEVDSEDRMNISISEYLGVTDLSNVSLSRLVKEISAIKYGDFNENSTDRFALDFAGTYQVLKAVDGVNTGLTTQAGEYYSIYGFEIHDVNVTAQGTDAKNVGFFDSLNGATVEGVTFVNPKIEVIASRGEENSVGVLAGSAVNATVTNASVELIGEQGDAYVMSIRQMTPASTNVGGIIGYAENTAVSGCSVTGLDVVASTLAGNLSQTLYTANAGGIVGVFDTDADSSKSIKDVTVASSRILVERNDRFSNVYMSYAGGIAAKATGKIENAAVNNTVLRDATCVIEIDQETGNATGIYSAVEDEHELVADRIGGAVAYAYGDVSINQVDVSGVTIRAFDIAGGIIGEIENSEDSSVSVTDCSVGDFATPSSSADVRVFGSTSLASGNARVYYLAAGGIVGQIYNLSALNISDCSFSGYVGTYSYDNLNKDCTAGGVIGSISEQLSNLSAVSVIDTTVSGEVSGFRSGKTAEAMAPYLGAAGGFIGKIRSTASGAADSGLVSHSVMAADVNLYNNSTGTKVDGGISNPNEISTNVGMILGSLIEEGNFAESATDLTAYFNNIYYSSYPQDIIPYGCMDFYGQNNSDATYTDINKATYTYTDEAGEEYTEVDNSFMIGSATDLNTPYDQDSYSSLAIIPVDTESEEAASASRHFRLMYDNLVFASDGSKAITFDKNSGAKIVIDDGATTATVTISEDYADKYGTLTVGNVTEDIIGEIVVTYSYGLKVGVQLISMEISGKGTETDPFLISNPKQFAVIRALPDAYYEQVANIDLEPQYGYSETVTAPLWADGEGFEPIGTLNRPFIGSYDGKGYLITNLYINRANTNYVGFFGYVGAGAQLSNIHIELAPLLAVTNDSGVTSTINGGILGKESVGGLAGFVNAATVTNCSVVKGNVIANTALGGLIGRSAGATIDSCFTSTTSYSKLAASPSAATKNVGALVGYVSGSTSITGSFTFGYASLGADREENSGTVGGMVGYVASGSNLNINNSFVGANVSDYRGALIEDVYYKGLTVGSADRSTANVQVSNLMVAIAGSVSQPSENRVINPVLGIPGGADTDKASVIYDVDLLGKLLGSDEQATEGEFSLDHVALASNAGDDSYTQAYVSLVALEVEPSEKEISDRKDDTLYVRGLFYPVTVKGSDFVLTSSVMDMSDNEEYPSDMDVEFYGNGSNKRTDLLFKDVDGGIKVYSNIYKTDTGSYTGKPYENGEMFFNDNTPYFIVSKPNSVSVQGTSVELYRKVIYPIQNRYADGGRVYPLATERQLSAVSRGAQAGTKFAVLTDSSNYTLTDNIALSKSDLTFNGIANYTGYFDGNGYTISNLSINKPDTDNVGFVGKMTNGALRNVSLEIETVSGANNVGALVGAVEPGTNKTVSIVNCSVVQKNGSGVTGSNNVGGLIGTAKGGSSASVSGSFTQVTVDGCNVVGGLVGYNETAIDNSYSTGDVNATISADSSSIRGIGGLAGVSTGSAAAIRYSFSSSAVDVSDAEYNPSVDHGVGGFVGYVGSGAGISTVFSSGSVRYCSIEGTEITELPACSSITLGVGGLVGILGSQTTDVYSSASVAANFGDVTSATAVGAGGVVGVSTATLETAYSSGSTLGVTATNDYSSANYGVGGVVGVITGGAAGSNLFFDLNTSVVDNAVGKIISGSTNNIGSQTTKVMTDGSSMSSLLSSSFGYTTGAYPYLTNFFDEDVSRTIMFNALLSIVAIQLNELDVTAAKGEGISMAMTIPTGITYDGVTYTYGFEADLTQANSATSIVDEATNTLSVQRTSNTMEQANFIITIKAVNSETADSDGIEYSTIASRPLSRVCAQMLGKEGYPYLISSQEDLAHVAMSETELSACPADSLYKEWNTPLNENGTPEAGKVYYRMMGYITLDGYERSFSNLLNGYSFDGNGYSVRNLDCALTQSLDENSAITNVTFENTVFSEGESLVGELGGEVDGINIFGTASGNNVAGIAQEILLGGLVNGSVVNLNYTGTASDSYAGIALVNNGTVSMSTSVGDISGSAKDAAGLVGTNSGVIMNSFTMGDIILTSPTGVVAGFVGINDGSVSNCYTRCNIMIDGENAAPKIGSFAAINKADRTVFGSFAAGLFDVMNGDSAADIKTVFIGSNSGSIEQSMFDKQMSGACFMDDFYLAERTLDLATLANMNIQAKGAYFVSENAGRTDSDGAVIDIEYPQLVAIVSTEEYITDENGKATAEETSQSRMYRTLRSYSKLSTATALVNNDNYIDYLPYSSVTTISNDFSWISENESVARPGFYGNILNPDGKMFTAGSSEAKTIVYTQTDIDDYYYSGETSRLSDRINIHVKVNNNDNPNFSGGNGTVERPFIITDKYEFVALSYYGSNPSNHFILGNDIDFTPGEGETVESVWSAYIDEFNATLDGMGFAISNVTIPESGNNAIFGSVNGGVITNLALAGVNVTVPEGNTGSAALLAAKVMNATEIRNCVVVGTIVGPVDANGNVTRATGTNVGGLVGETDGYTIIDGCVVSGKISTVAGNSGGIVGLAEAGTEITNCLSTVFVDGGENSVSGGVVGNGTATVQDTVFAGNAVGGINAGNISGGDGVTAINSYYDRQLSMIMSETNGVTAANTQYLTDAAAIDAMFNGSMDSYEGFEGYPIPATFVSDAMYSDAFETAAKLASAKIAFVNGVGSGTSTAFTSVNSFTGTEQNAWQATLTVTGTAAEYFETKTGTNLVPDTRTLALNQRADGEFVYALDSTNLIRYIDFVLGKTVKTVNYKLSGSATDHAVISAVTGQGNNKSAATAFDAAYGDYAILCENMIFAYDEAYGAYTFTVFAQLDSGLVADEISVAFDNSDTACDIIRNNDGTFTVVINSSATSNFSEVNIDIEVEQEDVWGVHKIISNFFKVF